MEVTSTQQPIDRLGLAPGAELALLDAGIETIGDLLGRIQDLDTIVGPTTSTFIRRTLQRIAAAPTDVPDDLCRLLALMARQSPATALSYVDRMSAGEDVADEVRAQAVGLIGSADGIIIVEDGLETANLGDYRRIQADQLFDGEDGQVMPGVSVAMNYPSLLLEVSSDHIDTAQEFADQYGVFIIRS